MVKIKKTIINKYKYIFGPVYSWRLGVSLGIDPVSTEFKTCSFDCVYCQLGKTRVLCRQRHIFVPTAQVIRELLNLPQIKFDYITFSGRGEPTLAKNIGQMIGEVKKIRKEKIAVITNASLLNLKNVRDDLARADVVLVKLDAFDNASLLKINRPVADHFNRLIDGIKKFRRQYKGKLALQIMFINGNKDSAGLLAAIAKEIRPDEIQINTPLRKSHVKPLTKSALLSIRQVFKGFPVRTVYDSHPRHIKPLNRSNMLKRHGRA